MRELTLGSLFDGLGGFPLAGIRNGIRPVWASDIEPFPIAVTRNHFPSMRHVGSVTEISGAELEPVDIITFGSPCQDLSVAGKQAGIHEGARSSLFFEAIRIIKEMREKDIADGRPVDAVRPRFAVWENVPGAFSSNKGKDFQAVLQAFCEIRGGSPILYLSLRKGSGFLPETSWETVSLLPGASWTPLAGAYPSVERESFLWQILQENAPPKYFLTKTACMGILRRAEKRGKELPPRLCSAIWSWNSIPIPRTSANCFSPPPSRPSAISWRASSVPCAINSPLTLTNSCTRSA